MLNPFYSGMGVLVSIFFSLSPVLWPPGYVRFPAYVWDGWGWFFVEGNDDFSQCYTNVSRRGDFVVSFAFLRPLSAMLTHLGAVVRPYRPSTVYLP